eukprot:1559320-Amphidinium_carterae.1
MRFWVLCTCAADILHQFGCVVLGRSVPDGRDCCVEDALQHLMNYVWPNVFETSPHLIMAVFDAIDGFRVSLGPTKKGKISNYGRHLLVDVVPYHVWFKADFASYHLLCYLEVLQYILQGPQPKPTFTEQIAHSGKRTDAGNLCHSVLSFWRAMKDVRVGYRLLGTSRPSFVGSIVFPLFLLSSLCWFIRCWWRWAGRCRLPQDALIPSYPKLEDDAEHCYRRTDP